MIYCYDLSTVGCIIENFNYVQMTSIQQGDSLHNIIIISGGQTGVDQIALAVARELGLKTGGWAPMGYLTEDGPNPSLLTSYGLREHSKPGYPGRTEANVRDSDMTFIFTNEIQLGTGSKLTVRLCDKYNKPYYINPHLEDINLSKKNITINIAGARGSRLPNAHQISANIKTLLIELIYKTNESRAREMADRASKEMPNDEVCH